MLFNRFISKDQPRTLEKERRVLPTSIRHVIHVEGDGSFTTAQPLVSAVTVQLGRCCIYSSMTHRASNQIPNYARPFCTADTGDLLASPPLRPRDALTTEHQRRASCPASKPQPVRTGWQCWQGSAEPTTPPGQWAQSLYRNKDRGDTKLKHNPCSMIDSFCSLIINFVTWIPKSN